MAAKVPRKNKTVFQATMVGIRGLITIFRTERKLRLLIYISWFIIAIGFLSKISYLEMMFLIFTWLEAVVAEIVNTSLEKAMDYASDQKYDVLIKRGKDFASASVFLMISFASLYSFVTILRQWL